MRRQRLASHLTAPASSVARSHRRYYSPFPKDYAECDTLYFCEFDLHFVKKREALQRYMRRNELVCSPTVPASGRPIYDTLAGPSRLYRFRWDGRTLRWLGPLSAGASSRRRDLPLCKHIGVRSRRRRVPHILPEPLSTCKALSGPQDFVGRAAQSPDVPISFQPCISLVSACSLAPQLWLVCDFPWTLRARWDAFRSCRSPSLRVASFVAAAILQCPRHGLAQTTRHPV